MASVIRGTRGVFGDGAGSVRPRNPVIEDIKPSHSWTEDSNGHYLLLDLPDFKKEQVKIQVNSLGDIKITGERIASETKQIRFEQTFKAPVKSNSEAIMAKFDGDAQILYITVPKRKAEEKSEAPKSQPQPKPAPEPVPAAPKDQAKDANMRQETAPCKRDSDTEKAKNDHARGSDRDHEHEGGQSSTLASGFSEEDLRKWEQEPSFLRAAVRMLSENKALVVTAVVAFSLGMLISRQFESDIGE